MATRKCGKCQDMMTFFWSGAAHIYYGLIAIILLGFLVFLTLPFLGLLLVMFAAGVFVDAWAHSFKH